MTERISCLLVTKGRLDMLKRSIAYYLKQSWPNKELIVVNDGVPELQDAIRSHVDDLKRQDIRYIFHPTRLTLGHLRNISVKAASGDVLCQWDDDDFYHPHRLEKQFSHMKGCNADASFFFDVFNYFADSRELFWTDWSFQRTQAPDLGHPGTLMCRRSVSLQYPMDGESAVRGEDAVVQIDLYRRCKVVGLREAGFLYTYVYHGMNTFERSHHRMIVDWMGFSAEYVRPRLESAFRHLSEYFPYALPPLSCRGGMKLELLPSPAGRGDASSPWSRGPLA